MILSRYKVLLRFVNQVCVVIVSIMSAKASPTTTQVTFAGSPLQLISGASDEFNHQLESFSLGSALSLQPIAPYCTIVRNGSTATVASIVMRWEGVVPHGRVLLTLGQLDLKGEGLLPGENVLMCPISGLSVKMARTAIPPQMNDSEKLATTIGHHLQRYSQYDQIIVSLDSVIFDDNTIIGPDVSGKMNEVNSERRIAKELAGKLLKLAPSERSAFLTTIINSSEEQHVSPSDPEGQRMRISEMLVGLVASTAGNEDRLQLALQDIINRQSATIYRRDQ